MAPDCFSGFSCENVNLMSCVDTEWCILSGIGCLLHLFLPRSTIHIICYPLFSRALYEWLILPRVARAFGKVSLHQSEREDVGYFELVYIYRIVFSESVNLIGYITVDYLLIVNC